MSITTNQITVAATATLIATIPDGGATVILTNIDATVTVYIGGSGVTTSIGKQLLAGQSLSGTFNTDEDIYGIVSAGTLVVDYLMNQAL